MLTLSWWKSLAYRNQSIDLLCKSVDWFLNDRDLRHERGIPYSSWKSFKLDNSMWSSRDLDHPSRHLLVQKQQWKHQNNVWNLFKVNNKDTRRLVLVSLLLSLNRIHTLFWCYHCWLWISNCRLGCRMKSNWNKKEGVP